MNAPIASRAKGQTGSFLLEALASLLIFSIGLIALVGLAGKAMNQAGQSKARNDASYLAGELIGEMWVSASTPAAFDLSGWQARIASALPNGLGTATVTNAGGTPPSYQVAITITWTDSKVQDGSGNPVRHKYETATQISKNTTN